MPSYNLPDFTTLPPPSPPLHAPTPVRPAFVPLPLPPPVPPKPKRTASPVFGERRKEGREPLKEIQVGSAERDKRKAVDENREKELPETPPASPFSEDGEGVRGQGGRPVRAPSEGTTRRGKARHHRRSSSMSTVSFASPPIAPQQRHTHPSAVPLHPFLIAQRRFTPLRPSPLSPHAPSSPRGRSSHFPHARPRAPLSRRYTRPLAESYLTSRAPVQVGSVPRFSTPLPFFSSNPPDTQQRLFESLVFLILTRRLAEKLQKMAMHQLGERAGLGGLRAGREMLIWAACVRMRREEERRERAPFCVIVPPLERPGLAHAGGAGGSPSARPLEGLPALEALVRPQEGVLAQRERGKRGHSRGYSMPVSPPLTPPPTPPPEVPSKPSHKRRLSSLTLPSLPSLRRSTSTPAPSPPPTALFTFDRPSLPRRSHSELGPSSGYGFAKSAEGDLPLSLRTLLPRSVERAVLRPAPTSSSPPPSPPLPPPASSEGFYPPSPSPFALDPFARRASLPLPATPRQIPLAPESMQRILPSGLVIFTSAAGSEGGRSGRGLEDWSAAVPVDGGG